VDLPVKNLWTLKSKGSESAFGGNEGYPDDPQSHYVYDTTVKNNDKLSIGDLLIIANKKWIIGVAEIEEIKIEENVSKVRFRCPVCRTQEIASRKNLLPKYKCRNKHEFAEPVSEEIRVTRFTAYYDSSFKLISDIETRVLTPYYINHNLYYSIQRTKLSFLQDYLPPLADIYLGTDINQQKKIKSITLPDTPYEPRKTDERKKIFFNQPGRDRTNSELICGIFMVLIVC